MATAPPQQSPFSTPENFVAWLRSRSTKFWIGVGVGAWVVGAILWMVLFPVRVPRQQPAAQGTAPQQQVAQPARPDDSNADVVPGPAE